MKRPLVAANWKMHPPPEGWDAIESPFRESQGVDVLAFAPYVYLKPCIAAGLRTGAQAGHPDVTGARTGCVSMAMLAQVGCEAVLCGHSERRRDQGETDAFVAQQVQSAIEAKLLPILCIGETADERAQGKQKEVIHRQLKTLLESKDISHLSSVISHLAIAYEPVWAIGTGDTATPPQAQEMHAFIRSLLPAQARADTRIVYGGSMNAANAAELLEQPDIDGGLVGGASLKPEEFRAIVQTAALKK